jgi:hypothetical protein
LGGVSNNDPDSKHHLLCVFNLKFSEFMSGGRIKFLVENPTLEPPRIAIWGDNNGTGKIHPGDP